jgi:hypothetical protein
MMRISRWPFMALLIALSSCGRSGLPATPLFDGVQGTSYAQGTRIIQDRLTARFPTGSPEGKLRQYLKQQGLRIEPAPRSLTPNTGVASFKYRGSVCGSQVRVSWRADAAGRVESIDALYADTGCP